MKFAVVTVTPFQQNCSVLWCEQTRQAAIVDPGGDLDTLIRSITGKLWPLGEDVAFISGHGPMSTFGDQRRFNPFVGDAVLARGA